MKQVVLLYAFLELIQSKILFLLIVFFLRIIHGIGSAFVGTLIYSVACSSANEDELKSSLGYIELGLSLGTSSGPLFASLFYKLGGYKLPFIALGIFLYPSFFNYLTNINIIIIFGSFALSMISFTYFFPCLSNHFKEKL